MISFYRGTQHFFDAFIRIIKSPEGKYEVTQLFPKEKRDINPNILRICFPIEGGAPPCGFYFSIKDANENFTYEYVSQTIENRKLVAYCLISDYFDPIHLPKIIRMYIDYLNNHNADDAVNFLQNNVYQSTFDNTFLNEKMIINGLIRELLMKIGVEAVAEIIMRVALDERIVILGYSLDALSKVSFAVLSLFYPLKWPGVFIPILPYNLCDTLLAPFPFIIGIHASMLAKVNWNDLETHTVVDVETQTLMNRNKMEIPSSVKSRINNFIRDIPSANILDLSDRCRSLFVDIIALGLGTKNEPTKLLKKYNNLSKDLSKYKDFERELLESQTVLILMRTIEGMIEGEESCSETFHSFWPNAKL